MEGCVLGSKLLEHQNDFFPIHFYAKAKNTYMTLKESWSENHKPNMFLFRWRGLEWGKKGEEREEMQGVKI